MMRRGVEVGSPATDGDLDQAENEALSRWMRRVGSTRGRGWRWRCDVGWVDIGCGEVGVGDGWRRSASVFVGKARRKKMQQ